MVRFDFIFYNKSCVQSETGWINNSTLYDKKLREKQAHKDENFIAFLLKYVVLITNLYFQCYCPWNVENSLFYNLQCDVKTLSNIMIKSTFIYLVPIFN